MLTPLRFYVKSNFGELKLSKNANFDNFRASEFWFFSKFEHFSRAKFAKSKIQNL